MRENKKESDRKIKKNSNDITVAFICVSASEAGVVSASACWVSLPKHLYKALISCSTK